MIPTAFSSSTTSPLASSVVAATLRFDLRTGDILKLQNRTAQFERRLDDKLQFLRVDDRNPIFLTDQQLAFLSASGEASFVAGSVNFSKLRGPLPNRLQMTEAQITQANRRLRYIVACIKGCLEGEIEPPNWIFKRSKSLDKIINRVANELGENAPAFTTVLEWHDRYVEMYHIHGKACLVDRNWFKGNRGSPFGHIGEVALERGVWRWLNPGMTMEMAYAKVVTTVAAYKRKLSRYMLREELALIKIPSKKTFERRCGKVDHYTRDYYQKGASYANLHNRTYSRQLRSDAPYRDVEVDHCTLDVEITDDETDIVLGRPDLIIFSDRATGMKIGRNIGYEAPSYASFVAGLRHAMYPKDMTRLPAIKAPMPCFGKIENLWVDNALHFIGDDIREGCKELKMNAPRFRPRNPWLKGSLERFFGFMNTGLIHLLPGTTLSNTVKKRELDSDCLGTAKIKLSQFEALLDFFLYEVANSQVSRGLGLVRGFGDIPIRVWK